MSKLFVALSALVVVSVASLTPVESVKASTSVTTTCNYALVAGAPWAPKSISSYHVGHIQCTATTASAIGYYRLTSQVYN